MSENNFLNQRGWNSLIFKSLGGKGRRIYHDSFGVYPDNEARSSFTLIKTVTGSNYCDTEHWRHKLERGWFYETSITVVMFFIYFKLIIQVGEKLIVLVNHKAFEFFLNFNFTIVCLVLFILSLFDYQCFFVFIKQDEVNEELQFNFLFRIKRIYCKVLSLFLDVWHGLVIEDEIFFEVVIIFGTL